MKTRDFYRPKDKGVKLDLPNGLTEKDCEAWTYLYRDKENKVTFGAMVFEGKKIKPSLFARYRTAEQRDEAILKEYLAIYKAKKSKDERKKIDVKLKVNDILFSSWGYEQTNIDFYQVVNIKGQFVELKALKSNISAEIGFLTYKVTARLNNFSNNEILKRKVIYPGDFVKINSYQIASLWDKRPLTETKYA
jgi:hypothetical protein